MRLSSTRSTSTCRRSFIPLERPYGGYIFDCDGTLADTMPIHHDAWCRALRAGGATFDFTWEIFTKRAGMSLEQTVVELSSEFAVRLDPVQVARDQRRFFAELEDHVTPLADVVELARRARRHAAVSVASGNSRASVLRTLSLIGASDVFDIIVTPEDVERGKPAPDMFLAAARQMGVPPAHCVVFEDAEFGFRAAAAAGMDLVRVASPRRAEGETKLVEVASA